MNGTAARDRATIRTGTERDLGVFAAFWLAMFEEVGNIRERDMAADWRERFAAYIARRMEACDGGFFVAESDGRIVGTAGAIVLDGYPFVVHGIKRGYIFGVRVDPAHRGHGIARTLTETAIAYLRELGCAKIRLHASRFGRRIYERIGFAPTNEMELVQSAPGG
jgi:GNAT superfamily N-acetyltransferase